MTATRTLAELNREILRQGQRLILGLSDEEFTHTHAPVHRSSLGDHLRHVIEHYQRFLIGRPERSIDYDARLRDVRISSDRNFASSVIEQVIEGLNELPDSDESLSIKMAVSSDGGREAGLTSSTLNRELQYLQAHTIHHYALIAMILKMQDVVVPAEFGIAPSTLQHEHAG